jgi:hypothetical protein
MELDAPAFAAGGRPFTPGEQQTAVDLSRGTLALYPAGAGQVLAQTFTPTSNQALGYVEVPVACESGVLLNVKIRAGLGGAILYEVNTAGLPEFVDGSMQLIQVYNPRGRHGIRLHRGRQYAIELAAFPGPDAVGNTCGIARSPAGNTYAGGQGWYEDPPVNGPGFLPLPNGEDGDDEDLPFITLVR